MVWFSYHFWAPRREGTMGYNRNLQQRYKRKSVSEVGDLRSLGMLCRFTVACVPVRAASGGMETVMLLSIQLVMDDDLPRFGINTYECTYACLTSLVAGSNISPVSCKTLVRIS